MFVMRRCIKDKQNAEVLSCEKEEVLGGAGCSVESGELELKGREEKNK